MLLCTICFTSNTASASLQVKDPISVSTTSVCSRCLLFGFRPMSSPTADWERVGDRFYRKVKLYDAVFDQDLELENYAIAGAPCAGAIGISQFRLIRQVKFKS